MRVALAQVHTTVGAVEANAAAILDAYTRARRAGARLVVTPELALSGYPPRDLLDRNELFARIERALESLAEATADGPALIVGAPRRTGGRLANTAVVLQDGAETHCRLKSLLPTYDVFDEARYFVGATSNAPVDIDGVPIGITICEDIWNDADLWTERRYSVDPVADLVAAGARIIINLSASPYHAGKSALRSWIIEHAARKHAVSVVYVNQICANDELVFDGDSVAVDSTGRTVAEAARFAEDLVIAEVPEKATPILGYRPAPAPTTNVVDGHEAEVWAALVLGVRDYFARTGFSRAVIGLSGGIDSALTAAVAVEALGAHNVTGVAMPSRYSSAGSLDDAAALARNLGVRLEQVSIEPMFSAFTAELAGVFAGRAQDVTEENIQARCRGVILMAVANKENSLVLTTGNKSEVAVGYCTLYGDMCGALGVIGDVYKTDVYRLARWYNRESELIPWSTITKPPSAELRPNQTDQDSLPPYEVLDDILRRLVEWLDSIDVIVSRGHDRATVERVARLLCLAEHKRRQSAPCIRITARAFGVGRRMPIAAAWRPAFGLG